MIKTAKRDEKSPHKLLTTMNANKLSPPDVLGALCVFTFAVKEAFLGFETAPHALNSFLTRHANERKRAQLASLQLYVR